MTEQNATKKVAIIGGGLVGALNACFFARRGFKVHVFECRKDIRSTEHVIGRSINLALSCRGREALKAVGLEEEVLKAAIPMRGRMLHNLQGEKKAVPYGSTDQQHIMAVDRRRLNELLLTAAENYSTVQNYFEHRFVHCNFESGLVEFRRPDNTTYSDTFDLVIGCDGAYSKVRQLMARTTRMSTSQDYIPHGYIELCFPPNSDGKHAMETNYLHIWPRNQFMMIALPNQDGSFTGTIFMPFEIFESIKTDNDLMEFFKTTFPDSINILGEDTIKSQFFKTTAQKMVTIKCSPFNVTSKALIMGDAAHAMVPFYGQGMNSGFEDCLIFDHLMEEFSDDLNIVLPKFTEIRQPDMHIACDLAVYNYIEMRMLVTSQKFYIRKTLDNFLHWLFPKTWVPLYTMVTFTRTGYTKCKSDREWQDKMINRSVKISSVVGMVLISLAAFRFTAGIHFT